MQTHVHNPAALPFQLNAGGKTEKTETGNSYSTNTLERTKTIFFTFVYVQGIKSSKRWTVRGCCQFVQTKIQDEDVCNGSVCTGEEKQSSAIVKVLLGSPSWEQLLLHHFDPMDMLSTDNHKTSSAETSQAQNMA